MYIFFVVRNKRRAEFWTYYHVFFCNRFRILTASALSAHFFWFLPRDLKILIQNGLFLIHKKCGELVSIFLKSLSKNKKSEPITLKPWGFWSSCNKPHENRSFVPHHKKIDMCPSHKYRFIFLWLGTNVGQSLEPIFMWFFARASESSGLQGYRFTF